jgi:hypothetical protein
MPQGGRVEAPDGQNRSTTPFTWNEPPDASMMMLPAEVTVFGWHPEHWVMLVTPAWYEVPGRCGGVP